jgi:hypothetical protein
MALLPQQAQAALLRLYLAVRAVREAAACGAALAARLDGPLDADALINAARALGCACSSAGLTAPFRQALHDVCGGALVGLVARAENLSADPGDVAAAESAALLAADHARLMRSAFADLDPDARAADLSAAPVYAADLVRGWAGSLAGPDGLQVALELGDLSGVPAAGCDLEAAALGRVLANHLDNAARFAAGGCVGLTVVAVGEALTRWVTHNALDAGQQRWLSRQACGDLLRLYRGGLTRGGKGIGLAASAAVVAACFGLPSAGVAVREGYLGAKMVGGIYYAWWHWPAYPPGRESGGSR